MDTPPRPVAADPSLTRLTAILGQLGEGVVWRPVRDHAGRLLAAGSGIGEDGLSEYVQGVSFSGKSVCDLGCNLGYFSLMAADQGAREVLGLDVDPLVIEAAGLLAGLHGRENVRFRVADFTAAPATETFDLVLLIDFIGRGTIAKGRLDAVLDAAVRHSRREMVFTLRPIYDLADLPTSGADDLTKQYGPQCVTDGRFHLLDYVTNRLGQWRADMLTPGDAPHRRFKHAVRFTRS